MSHGPSAVPEAVPAGAVSSSGTPAHGVSFAEAVRVWARVAALSFGGPAGQIAVMHRILVEEKRWIGENRFLHALNYCMLLPGPEAQQLAVYIGWLLHKTKGGLVAGGLFVLPGLVAIMILSLIYAAWGKVGIVAALFFGLKAAVLAVVLQAVVRVGSRALKNRIMIGIAAAAFVAIFFLKVPFPLIILGAGLIGYLGGRAGHRLSHRVRGDLGNDLGDHDLIAVRIGNNPVTMAPELINGFLGDLSACAFGMLVKRIDVFIVGNGGVEDDAFAQFAPIVFLGHVELAEHDLNIAPPD